MSLSIKICGLTDKLSVETAVRLQVDYIGCSFYKDSPRNVDPAYAARIMEDVPSSIKKVATCSNPDNELLNNIFKYFKPDYIQLDDISKPERVAEIRTKFRTKIIKTIYISNEDDLDTCKKYITCSDMFLFDGRHRNDMYVELPDTVYDWSILKRYKLDVPWILSGGLNRFNVKHAARASKAKIINASASLESSPGVKDTRAIEEFVKAARVVSYF